jgi:hypothetical protein
VEGRDPWHTFSLLRPCRIILASLLLWPLLLLVLRRLPACQALQLLLLLLLLLVVLAS